MDARRAADHNAAMQPRRISSAAAMLAEPARAAMVLALMDGRARRAKALALDAGVTPQTASVHLKKLVGARILSWEGQGREKYFRIAGREVAEAVEALAEINACPPPAARELRFARCCYDHLAGTLGVAVTERLLRPGNTVLRDLGIDSAALESARRPLFRCCTDWTERRAHVAGAVGAALLRHYLDDGWLLRVKDSRRLAVTPRGRQMFVEQAGVADALFA
jgi:DNA-binding transcriptional ArsR family regulator